MKRALVLSIVLHLAALTGAFWWWSEKKPGASVQVHFVTHPVSAREAPAPGPTREVATRTSPVEQSAAELQTPMQASEQDPPASDPAPEAVIAPPALPEPSVTVPAAVLSEIKPEYPRAARRNKWEGVAEFLVDVDISGRWAGSQLLVSSGHAILDEAALQALKAAGYRPASRDGMPEPARLAARVTFVLQP